MKKYIIIAFVASMGYCIYNINKMSNLTAEYKALEAEVAQKTSGEALVGIAAKSFFDGFTFGAFAEEGMLTEYNKASRWEADVLRREARIKSAYSDAETYRNWAGSIALICGVGLFFGFFDDAEVPVYDYELKEPKKKKKKKKKKSNKSKHPTVNRP